MQGTIAQIVALVIEGNAALRGIDTGMRQGHSTMSFCEFVHFVDLAKTSTGWSERRIADDPMAWFQYLSDHDVTALRMSHGPSRDPALAETGTTDRMLVGFVGGGGRWLLEASKPSASDYWEARWEMGDQGRADRKIWQVTYGRIARNHAPGDTGQENLHELRAQFRETLMETKAFADRQGLDSFANCFARGLEDLDAEMPANGFHKEFLNPSLLPLEARQLLSAAQSSWVFGGMGSWNDLGFDGEEQAIYEHLSEALYRVANQAIVAAANTSAGRPGSSTITKAKRPWWRAFG